LLSLLTLLKITNVSIYPNLFVTPFRIEIKTFWTIQALNILGYGRAMNILRHWRAINILGHWRVINIWGHWRAINILDICGTTWKQGNLEAGQLVSRATCKQGNLEAGQLGSRATWGHGTLEAGQPGGRAI
jgi:hypothetical protein